MSRNDARCRLYLVTPPDLSDPAAFAPLLAETLDGGDVACVQLRIKNRDDTFIRSCIQHLKPVVQGADAAFLLNDRPDLAAETDCDGVHVGQEDVPYHAARKLVGPDRIVGVTCHDSRHLAMVAGEDGADYVAFGAMFPTETKDAKTAADIELVRWWAELMTVPVVAIGGITVENCEPVIEAGADFLAVCNGIWKHPDGPSAAVTAFNRVVAETPAWVADAGD